MQAQRSGNAILYALPGGAKVNLFLNGANMIRESYTRSAIWADGVELSTRRDFKITQMMLFTRPRERLAELAFRLRQCRGFRKNNV